MDDRYVHWKPHGESLYIDIAVDDSTTKRVEGYIIKIRISKKDNKPRCRIVSDSTKK